MLKHRKDARQRLKLATLEEFSALIHGANLTPTQEKIINLHIGKGRSISNIAIELFCCEATVRKYLATAYDKVAKL